MHHPSPIHGVSSTAADGVAPMTTIFSIMCIIVTVGMVLFIAAVGIALGVGFGVGLRTTNSFTVKLPAPVVNCNPSSTCGCAQYPPTFSSRIINGDAAATNSWPWMVYLTMNNVKTCTGFLISQRHVLTAASCVTQFAYNVSVSIGINAYQSSYGGINITNTTGLTAINIGDIAVVTLGINITYNATVKPCCITSSTSVPVVNTNGVIAGWGETSTTSIGTVSPTLRQAVVEVRNSSICSTANDTLCASYDSISECPIDAGGPLMVNYNNLWTCVGIMIGGRSTCSNPITFTRISAYAALITNVTGIVF
jgi:secreted trypsin-like serine protease